MPHDQAWPPRLRAVTLLLTLLTACGAPPHPVVDYDELVSEEKLTASPPLPRPRELVCADETWTATVLDAPRRLTATVELGQAGSLVVSGCTPSRRRGGGDGPGRLTLRLGARDGTTALERHLPLPAGPGWWERRVDLAALGGRLDLELAVELAPGRSLYLREVRLRSEHPPDRVPRPPRRAPASGPDGWRPQILLISVDTLREDSVGRLGHVETTPVLDRLAAEGWVFTPHYAAASWTQPSHGSLLTGHPPAVHGAVGPERPLHPGLATLAGRLRDAGLTTGALVYDTHWLAPEAGFGRGFDSYRVRRHRAGRLVREAVDWLGTHRDEPFFYFLHTFEPHSDLTRLPYESPQTRRDTVEALFGVAGYGCRRGACASRLLRALHTGRLAPLPEEAAILRLLYDRGVAYTDDELGVLLAELERLGLYDELLVVLTSDHGESFLEHGQLLHGTPWEPVIRVPLIVKWPFTFPEAARAGHRVERISSALDLTPTLLAAAGLEDETLPGRDLRHLAAGGRERPAFVGHNFRAVVDGRWKAVFDHEWGEPLLFDLETDPGEHHNLAAERPGELARLRALADRWRERNRLVRERLPQEARAAPELSEEERRRLQALGYLD